MRPSASSRMVTTSALDSRHGSSLEWCSYGPMNTTGAGRGSRSSSRTSLSIAPVAPEPQKTTTSSSPPLTGAVDDRGGRPRAGAVVWRPVADASVCVFAYSGSTRSRMKSSTKDSERPDAV